MKISCFWKKNNFLLLNMNFATIKEQFSTPAKFAAELEKRATYYDELYFVDEDSSDEDVKHDNIAMQLLFDESYGVSDIDDYIKVAYEHCKEFYARDSSNRQYFWERVRDKPYVTQRLVNGGYMNTYIRELKKDEFAGFAMLIFSALANAGFTKYFSDGTFIAVFSRYQTGFDEAFYDFSASALKLVQKYHPHLIQKFIESWNPEVDNEFGLIKVFTTLTEADMFDELASLDVHMVNTNTAGSFLDLNEQLITFNPDFRRSMLSHESPLKKIVQKIQNAIMFNKIYFGRIAVTVDHLEQLMKNKKDILLAKIYNRTVRTGKYNFLFKTTNIKVKDIFYTNRDDEFANEKLSLQEYFSNVGDHDVYNLVADDYEKVDECIDNVFKHFNIKRQKIYEFLSQ